MEPMSELFNTRAFALEQAVKLHMGDGPPSISSVRDAEIVESSRFFEKYLAEKPSDQQQHADTASPLAKTIS